MQKPLIRLLDSGFQLRFTLILSRSLKMIGKKGEVL